jgi:hypothetical protein
VNSAALGKGRAASLGAKPVVLMRGHGDTVAGRDIRECVARTINLGRGSGHGTDRVWQMWSTR